jgi:uncharacterized Zn-finger protein
MPKTEASKRPAKIATPQSPMFSGTSLGLGRLRRIISTDPEETQLLIDTASFALPDALNVKKLKDGSGTVQELNLNLMAEHLPGRNIAQPSTETAPATLETPRGSEYQETMFGNVPTTLGLRDGKNVSNSLLCDEITPAGAKSKRTSEVIFGGPQASSVKSPGPLKSPLGAGKNNIPFDMVFELQERKSKQQDDSAKDPNGKEVQVYVKWYCGSCNSKQVKTEIVDLDKESSCSKCQHLFPIKKKVDLTNTAADPTDFSDWPSFTDSISGTNVTVSLSQVRQDSYDSTNPSLRDFRTGLQRQNSLDPTFKNDDGGECLRRGVSSNWFNVECSLGEGSRVSSSSSAENNFGSFLPEFSMDTDADLDAVVRQNLNKREVTKVGIRWYCPQKHCGSELDLWDEESHSPTCRKCKYLLPTRKPILAMVKRRFECPICHKGFSRRNILMEHQNTHGDFKPHQCKWHIRGCKMRFNDLSNRTKHENSSCKYMEGEPQKNFKCVKCDKRYIRKVDLQNHILTKHEGVAKPYECDLCGLKYANRANLSRHKQKVHNGKVCKAKTKGKGKASKAAPKKKRKTAGGTAKKPTEKKLKTEKKQKI